MSTKRIEIINRETQQREQADMLVCPECQSNVFFVYRPDLVNHVHFQCSFCCVTFCDGCHTGPQCSAEHGAKTGGGS
jgi:transposase-like protein